MRETRSSLALLVGILWLPLAVALRAEELPKADGYRGTLLLCGSGLTPSGALALLPRREPPRNVVLVEAGSTGALQQLAGELEQGKSPPRITQASAGALREVRAALEPVEAGDVVFLYVEDPTDAGALGNEPAAAVLHEVLKRGGTIVGVGHAAEWLCAPARDDQTEDSVETASKAVGLLAGVQWLPAADEDSLGRLSPGNAGLHLPDDAAVILQRRRLFVPRSVSAAASIHLRPTTSRDAREIPLNADRPADITTIRRAAAARDGEPFPPAQPTSRTLESGTLLIAGGGALTNEMVAAFVEAAGGREARIVVIPTAEERPQLEDRGDVRRFRAAGAASVEVMHTSDPDTAASQEFLAPLEQATGVWFGGGRQWRFLDAYEGTPFVEGCHAVLRRGGAIGGSSAGATIQGEYLVRGSPLGNEEMMCEGYERGFGFLPGTAIDQHFTQRSRRGDMEQLKQTFPQLLGIGIDESTALVVQGATAEVIGAGSCFFFDRFTGDAVAATEVAAGAAYDLGKLQKLDRSASP